MGERLEFEIGDAVHDTETGNRHNIREFVLQSNSGTVQIHTDDGELESSTTDNVTAYIRMYDRVYGAEAMVTVEEFHDRFEFVDEE